MDDFERFVELLDKMFSSLHTAGGVRITISSDGNVMVQPVRPPKKKIYVPFEVVDAGEEYLLTLDLRWIPLQSVALRVKGDGVLVETPRGERFIYFEQSVDPNSVRVEENNGIIELSVKKGKGDGEKVIRFPQS